MKKILNSIFGEKNKDGKCRPWNHIMVYKPEESFSNTGQYVNGEPIKRRYVRDINECSTCGHKEYGDLNFG